MQFSDNEGWNAAPELISQIKASIRPVNTENTLANVLSTDFPRDCSNLPISGGWGYTQADSILFIRDRFPVPSKPDFVPVEYHIAQKIIYEELIIFRPKGIKFSGITMNCVESRLIQIDHRRYDNIHFSITCWNEWHWAYLKNEWEANDFGRGQGFDGKLHEKKRAESQVTYQREFWFDITDVF